METTTALTTMESRTITLQERCAKLDFYNPATITKTFAAVKTTTDCLAIQDAGEPVLLTIAREGDSVKLSAMLALNIAALDRFLHLNNPLSEEEIDFIAEQIIDEFGNALTFADVHLVLKRAKAGQFGKFYERLSAPDVLGWFRDYYSQRLDAAEQYNLNKDRRQYRRGGDNPLPLLGYGVNKDGRIVIDPEKVARINEQQQQQKEAEAAKRQQKVDEDNAYASYKASLVQKWMIESSNSTEYEQNATMEN